MHDNPKRGRLGKKTTRKVRPLQGSALPQSRAFSDFSSVEAAIYVAPLPRPGSAVFNRCIGGEKQNKKKKFERKGGC